MSYEEQSATAAQGNVEIPHGDSVKPNAPAHGEGIHLPAPTPWPIVAALGFTFLVAGILTHYVISIMGFLLLVYGCVGWFRDVLPHEAHEEIQVKVQEISIASSRKSVSHISTGEDHRSHVGEGSFSPLVGLKGGIAGGVAMIVPAIAYGLIAQHSIWYPVNLLGGAGIMGAANPSMQDLRVFHAGALGIAAVIHIISCTLIGLVYGSALPLMPRHPIVLGGIIAPLAWTGLLYGTLPIINPEMSKHINWANFLIAQLTFGLVAGWVVSRSPYARSAQKLPLAMRLGLEGGGMGHGDKEDRQ
jgi:hypothetical protein